MVHYYYYLREPNPRTKVRGPNPRQNSSERDPSTMQLRELAAPKSIVEDQLGLPTHMTNFGDQFRRQLSQTGDFKKIDVLQCCYNFVLTSTAAVNNIHTGLHERDDKSVCTCTLLLVCYLNMHYLMVHRSFSRALGVNA